MQQALVRELSVLLKVMVEYDHQRRLLRNGQEEPAQIALDKLFVADTFERRRLSSGFGTGSRRGCFRGSAGWVEWVVCGFEI